MAPLIKRQRPKPRFRTDLPIKVIPFQCAAQLEALVQALEITDPGLRADILIALQRLATDIGTSRRLQAYRCRPDESATLRAVASMAGSTAMFINDLPPPAVGLVERRLPLETKQPAFRLPYLHSVISDIRDCAGAARLANEIPESLARRDGWPFVRDETLQVLSEITDHLWKKLSCLNSATEWALIVVEQDISAPSFETIDGAVRRVAVKLMWLQEAATAAYAEEAQRRGPQSDGVTFRAVRELVRIYELATGEDATHSTGGVKTGYTGEAMSPAGQYVMAAMDVIDPTGPRRGIRDALEHLLWPCRAKLAARRAARRPSNGKRAGNGATRVAFNPHP